MRPCSACGILRAMHDTITRLFLASLLAALLAVALPAGAQVRFIPQDAALGVLEMGVFPEARIDGVIVRFGAGARIFNANNQIVLPASLTSAVRVAYIADFQGLLRKIWLVTDREAQALQQATRNNR